MLYQLDEVQYGEMKKTVGKHHEDNFRTSWPRGQGASPCSFHSMIIEHQFLSQVCKLSVHRWCCKYHCTSANWWWIEYSVAKDFLLESAWVVKVRLWICCCFLDLWDFPALDDIWGPSTFAWLHSDDTGALRGPKVWSTLRLCWRTMGSSQLPIYFPIELSIPFWRSPCSPHVQDLCRASATAGGNVESVILQFLQNFLWWLSRCRAWDWCT